MSYGHKTGKMCVGFVLGFGWGFGRQKACKMKTMDGGGRTHSSASLPVEERRPARLTGLVGGATMGLVGESLIAGDQTETHERSLIMAFELPKLM